MLRRLIALTLWITLTTTVSAQKAPDFAFPKQVETTSTAALKAAIAQCDSPATLRALIDLTIARNLIAPDSTQSTVDNIASISAQTTDPVLKAMTNLLEATALSQLYLSQRWKIDQRTTPGTHLIDTWNRRQYADTITALCLSATSQIDALTNIPISRYYTCITHNSLTPIYFPTLYDFAATKAIHLLAPLVQGRMLGPYWLTDSQRLSSISSYHTPSGIVNHILSLYASLINSDAPQPVRIYQSIERLKFINTQQTDYTDRLLPQSLMRLYREYSGSEFAADILVAIGNETSHDDIDTELYQTVRQMLDRNPNSRQSNALRNILARMEQKEAIISAPIAAAPGSEIEVSVTSRNVASLTLALYDASSTPQTQTDFLVKNTAKPMLPLVSATKVSVEESIPFATTVTAKVKLPKTGTYIIVPQFDGMAASSRLFTKIWVGSVWLAEAYTDRSVVLAIDPSDGSPRRGVNIKGSRYDYRKQQTVTIFSGVTDRQGEYFPKFSRNADITASYKGDTAIPPLNVWEPVNHDIDQSTHLMMEGFTSLPLYHPADTVEFAAVVYEISPRGRQLAVAHQLKFNLLNANREKIDSATLTTDAWGRVAGRFALPQEGLTGLYNIQAEGEVLPDNIPLMVSDYKLPTFAVTLAQAQMHPDSVVLTGQARTYSSVAVANAKVALTLGCSNSLWWWRGGRQPVECYTAAAATDREGCFRITVPRSVLAQSPYPNGVFTATATVTSPQGESHESITRFTLGKPYTLSLRAMPQAIEAAVMPLEVKITSFSCTEATLPARYAFSSDGVTKLEGCFNTSTPTVDLRSLRSGVYTLRVWPDDATQADADSTEVTVYRQTDKSSPRPEMLLWYPDKSARLQCGRGEWLYATGVDAHLRATLMCADTVVFDRLIPAPKGMHRLVLELPEGYDKGTLTILAVGDYRQATALIDVKRIPTPSIRIESQSIRSHVTPGTEEEWTLRIIPDTGSPQECAVVAGMYSASLESLRQHKWSLEFLTRHERAPYWTTFSGSCDARVGSALNLASEDAGIDAPGFEIWGMNLAGRNGFAYNGLMRSKSAMAVADLKAEATEETAVMVMDSTADSGGGDFDEDKFEAEEIAGEPAAAPQMPQHDYRPAEMPLAFFRPLLTTDTAGVLTLKFTVPNANTTWRMQMAAYTRSLLSAVSTTDIVASKPVMVEANAPRFARTGDVVEIPARVTNNSSHSHAIVVTAKASALTTLSTLTDTLRLEAGEAATVRLQFTVPAQTSALTYEIAAADGTHTDAERIVMAIEPSASEVRASLPFYIAPGETAFETTLPVYGEDAQVSLQYCANPLWEVVCALPGLSSRDPYTSVESAEALAAAVMARKLLADNPQIAEAIATWTGSDRSDSTLISMLERNSQLKQLLLSSTPWLQQAAGQTERMQRLALLLNHRQVSRAIDKATAQLRRLQRPDGGWAWIESQPTSSTWATATVLHTLGRLNRLGCLPADLSVDKALSLTCEQQAKAYRRNPKGDFTDFAYLCTLFPKHTLTTAQNAVKAAGVQQCVGRWRKASIADKTTYALILNANGYRALARQVMASIGEYARYSPQRGMWWPSLSGSWSGRLDNVGITAHILQAYATVMPECVETDRIRQWLILEKESTDWGCSPGATEAVTAILTTSAKWIVPASQPDVTVGDKEIAVPATDAYTGAWTTDITRSNPSGARLSITRQADTPAWGSVMARYNMEASMIEAFGSDDLRIEKSLIAANEETSTLTVGEKVTVRLIITAGRDLDFVTLTDERGAAFEPVEQLPVPLWAEGLCFYRENADTQTRFFIDRLPRGTYVLTYDLWANNAGRYTVGIATAQSQYAPRFTAHSAGQTVAVKQE